MSSILGKCMSLHKFRHFSSNFTIFLGIFGLDGLGSDFLRNFLTEFWADRFLDRILDRFFDKFLIDILGLTLKRLIYEIIV